MLNGRVGVACGLLICWIGLTLKSASAQDVSKYPQKTVTIVCPWGAGGGTDRIARFWADALNREFHRPFVVVNRVGGSGAIGHFAGAHAPRNGYTLTLITSELSTMHRMRVSTLTHEDFDCILQVNADPAAILVRKDAPWESLNQWLDDVRAHPRSFKMSGTATGGIWDIHRIGLMRTVGLPADAVVWVPYQSSAEALQQLMGKHLDVVCCSLAEAKTQLESGSIRALTVMSEEPLAEHPEIRTARQEGIDWVATVFRGLCVPKDTPVAITEKLEQTCLRIAQSDAYRQAMQKNGFGITIRNSKDFREFLKQQDLQWKDIVVGAGYDRGLSGNRDPGPLALPVVLVAGLVLLSVIEIVRTVRSTSSVDQNGETKSNPPIASHPRSNAQPLAVVTSILLYAIAMPFVGFNLSTCLFSMTLTRILGATWLRAAACSGILIGLVWLIFTLLFSVQLP